MAIWDQAEASLVFASGMAAISTTLWAYARPGTVIIHSGPVYGGTDFLLKKILPQLSPMGHVEIREGLVRPKIDTQTAAATMDHPARRRRA